MLEDDPLTYFATKLIYYLSIRLSLFFRSFSFFPAAKGEAFLCPNAFNTTSRQFTAKGSFL